MSIQSAIQAAQGRVSAAYDAIVEKGGERPTTANLAALPDAIAALPSGGELTPEMVWGDLSWWLDGIGSCVYNRQNLYFPNENFVASPFLTKGKNDYIKISSNMVSNYSANFFTKVPTFVTDDNAKRILVNTYDSDYNKIDYWALHPTVAEGHILGNASIFRVFITKWYADYIKIENLTTGQLYWQGGRYNSSIDNDLTKETLLRAIPRELSHNTILYLSSDKYAELANDADVVLALSLNTNVTLASA